VGQCLRPVAKTQGPHALLRVRLAFSATDRQAVQRKKPSVTSCHSPLILLRWLTVTVKPARAAAGLRVAELEDLFGIIPR
jgi:hypothetical protein